MLYVNFRDHGPDHAAVVAVRPMYLTMRELSRRRSTTWCCRGAPQHEHALPRRHCRGAGVVRQCLHICRRWLLRQLRSCRATSHRSCRVSWFQRQHKLAPCRLDDRRAPAAIAHSPCSCYFQQVAVAYSSWRLCNSSVTNNTNRTYQTF